MYSCCSKMWHCSNQHGPALYLSGNHTAQLFMGFVQKSFYNIITIRCWNVARAKSNICLILGGDLFSPPSSSLLLHFWQLFALYEVLHFYNAMQGCSDVLVLNDILLLYLPGDTCLFLILVQLEFSICNRLFTNSSGISNHKFC